MKAVMFETFGEMPTLVTLPDPTPAAHGVVLKVEATGVCRSDWHGWKGHDPDIELPHVPGHELAGVVVAVGKDVTKWAVGDKVTVPFICSCGSCSECHAGHQQVCLHQEQPGFTHWGSFAEYVAIHRADLNLSAVMIAAAAGANVIGVDLDPAKLDLARALGAAFVIDGRQENVPEAIREITRGGANVSIDALGHTVTMTNSILCLRPRGKHIQVGLMLGDHAAPAVPMPRIVGQEIEILGSHGMQAHRYGAMLDMVASGKLDPARLVGDRISLAEAPAALVNMDRFQSVGATIITRF